jgi:hypothetical protein
MFTCQADGVAFEETLTLEKRNASMAGSEAIKLGFNMIAEHVVQIEG